MLLEMVLVQIFAFIYMYLEQKQLILEVCVGNVEKSSLVTRIATICCERNKPIMAYFVYKTDFFY